MPKPASRVIQKRGTDLSCLATLLLPCCCCCCCQLGLRTLSVGLANNLLLNLPEPFKRSTFAAAAASAPGGAAAPAQPAGEADAAFTATPAPTRAAEARRKGPNVPAGMVVAPWSVVALATLLQRWADVLGVCVGGAGPVGN